jgi:hypothetical protein
MQSQPSNGACHRAVDPACPGAMDEPVQDGGPSRLGHDRRRTPDQYLGGRAPDPVPRDPAVEKAVRETRDGSPAQGEHRGRSGAGERAVRCSPVGGRWWILRSCPPRPRWPMGSRVPSSWDWPLPTSRASSSDAACHSTGIPHFRSLSWRFSGFPLRSGERSEQGGRMKRRRWRQGQVSMLGTTLPANLEGSEVVTAPSEPPGCNVVRRHNQRGKPQRTRPPDDPLDGLSRMSVDSDYGGSDGPSEGGG